MNKTHTAKFTIGQVVKHREEDTFIPLPTTFFYCINAFIT